MGKRKSRGRARPPAPPALRLKLLELPAAWQVLLVQSLPAKSLHALLQICQQVRDLVLRHAPTVTLQLQLQQVSPGQASRCLQLASQHCHRLGLRAAWGDPEESYSETLALWRGLFTPAFHSLLASCSGMLANITRLHLMHAQLEGVLPPVICQALPNLTSLTLERCCISWGACTAASFQGVIALDTLRLRHCSCEGSASVWKQQLQAQLAQLTCLRALQLVKCSAEDADLEMYGLLGAAVPAHQLTHLSVQVWSLRNPQQAHLSWLEDSSAWASRLEQHLQHLSLGDTWLDNAGLEVVLQMASLTRLDVDSFDLHSSMAHLQPPAQLQLIICTEASLQVLASLPLDSPTLTIKVGRSDLLQGLNVEDADVLQEAAVNAARCQGLQWESEVLFEGDWGHLGADQQQELMVKLLQLVDAPELCFEMTGLDPSVIDVLAQHAQASRRLYRLVMSPYNCPWDAAVVSSLVSRLPSHIKSERWNDCSH